MTQKTMFGIYKTKPEPGAEYRTDLPIPEVGENDVLVRVKAAAICGTDLHILPWSPWAAARLSLPMVFGHEFAGEIVEVGGKVKDFKVGDRVAGETHIPCNNCLQCRTNNRHICENMKIIGVQAPGAFSEYISMPQDCAYLLPDDISYEMGAMLEPMGVGVHGVSVAKVKDKVVAIYGCGPIGLMAIGAAKVWGAKKIYAVDVFDDKLDVAKVMGADILLNSKNTDPVAAIKADTDGAGAEIVIDYTGSGPAILSGFASLRKGGTFVMVGLPSKELTMDFSDNIIYKEAIVIGVTGRRMYETWDECREILAAPGFSLEPVVGGVFPLKDYQKAFDALAEGKPGKMLLIP